MKKADDQYFANMHRAGTLLELTKPNRSAIRQRRDKIFAIIDSVIRDVTQMEENPRLQSEANPDVRKYIMSGKLSEDADIQLKTPKLVYTQEMWESEVERSLQPLDMPTFNQLVGYVTETKQVPYLVRKRSRQVDETEYQRILKQQMPRVSQCTPHLTTML